MLTRVRSGPPPTLHRSALYHMVQGEGGGERRGGVPYYLVAESVISAKQVGKFLSKARNSPNPPLLRDCVAMGETRVIPAKAGIQVFEIVIVSYSLDARLRGHDELRHTL